MMVLKCKMCGGNLDIEEGMSVCECEYCGSKQTVPNLDNEKKFKLFERANKLRSNCEFDKAAGVYENIVADYSEDAEGYWGLILCRYGIEYVDDPATGKKVPTCHRSSFESIMDDEDFEMVMENSDAVSRAVYREEAKYIEEIRKGIIEVSGKEEPYDIFICYKETDENGDRTLDSVLAQDVYDELTNKGYRVFFSRITLEDKLGVEYEPYIFAALNSSKVMLAFGTSYDYYNAVWVKNEWSRYLKLMAKDKSKHLIPCFKNVDAYDIPKEFSRLQSQDMGKIGAMQDLMRGVDKLLRPEEAVVKSKVDAGEHNMNAGSYFNVGGINVEALMKRGFMALEDGEWDKATDFFEQVLNSNAENGMAYFGELLSDYKCSDEDALGERIFENIKNDLKMEKRFLEIEDKGDYYAEKYECIKEFSQEELKEILFPKFLYETTFYVLEKVVEENKKKFVISNNKKYQRMIKFSNDQIKQIIINVQLNVSSKLDSYLKLLEEDKNDKVSKLKEKERAYFEMLSNVFDDVNPLAIECYNNYEKELEKWENDYAIYVDAHKKWEEEYAQWQIDIRTYMAQYELIITENRKKMEEWSDIKKRYDIDKEEWILKLEEIRKERRLAHEGNTKLIKKLAKEEKQVEAILNSMKEPEKPKISLEPMKPREPREPVLREKPIPVYDLVRKNFFERWNEKKETLIEFEP